MKHLQSAGDASDIGVEVAPAGLDRSAWECAMDAAADGAGAPLQQRWAYGAAMQALGAEPIRLMLRRSGDADPLALVQAIGRKALGRSRLALAARGPVWLAPAEPSVRQAVFSALRRDGPRAAALAWPSVLLLTPDGADAAAAKAAGLTALTTPASIAEIDLRPDLKRLRIGLKGKWRNRLVAAERAGLVATARPAPAEAAAWLLAQDAEQQRVRGYRAPPAAFAAAFAATAEVGDGLILSEVRDPSTREALAGMLFLRAGATAHYHVGWSGPEGRRNGAHGLALWRAMAALREAGVRTLDLGAIDTEDGAGRARFKLGAGARVARLAPSCA